jgi:hypothetical protein
MIHVVVMKRFVVLPLLIHIEFLWRSRSRTSKNRGVGFGVGRFKNPGVGVGSFVYRLHSPAVDRTSAACKIMPLKIRRTNNAMLPFISYLFTLFSIYYRTLSIIAGSRPQSPCHSALQSSARGSLILRPPPSSTSSHTTAASTYT